MQRKLFLAAAGAVLLAAAAWLWRACEWSGDVTFFPRHAPAEWLVYPKPPVLHVQGIAELPAVFRRSFLAPQVPGTVSLSLRMCRRGIVCINGQNLEIAGTPANWKAARTLDIGRWLKPGQNTISVTVFNQVGPPALWLTLQGSGLGLKSDASWEVSYAGAVWRPAHLAAQPLAAGEGNLSRGSERPLRSLLAAWQPMVLLLALSAGLLLAARWWFARASERVLPPRWKWAADPAAVVLVLSVVLWGFLFAHNVSFLPRNAGFDTDGHLDYIRYIQAHRALPLADQGWEMHQPPLYYLLGAALLNAFGFLADSFDGLVALRGLGLLIGLVHLGFVFACLRLLFPGETSKQAAGLGLAAFLPMHLYLSQYITNETLVSCLSSITLFFLLRLLRSERPSFRTYALAGICLGLALLTKVTAVVLAPFAVATLLYCAYRDSRKGAPGGNPKSEIRNLSQDSAPECSSAGRRREFGFSRERSWLYAAAGLALGLAVCGWHYARVWRHFGQVLFAITRFGFGTGWWQDPGYHTTAYFTHFGRSLTAPLFSGLSSFGDGLYSTMWGDGFCGGEAALMLRPPWNYHLMSVGFLLALAPTGLLLAGVIKNAARVVRNQDLSWTLLLSFSFAMLLALVHLNLNVPGYAEAKSFYGLCALVPMCALVAAGFPVAGRVRLTRGGAALLLVFWALTSYASYWIRADAADTQAILGRGSRNAGDYPAALAHLTAALRAEPHHAAATIYLVGTLLRQERVTEARTLAQQAVQEHPGDAQCHFVLASVLDKQGDLAAAIQSSRRAVELAPDDPNARLQLATLLFRSGRHREAILAGREALRLSPGDPEVHALLACALLAQADLERHLQRRADAPVLLSPSNDGAQPGLHSEGAAAPEARDLSALTGDEPLPMPLPNPSAGDLLVAGAVNHFQLALKLAPDSPDVLRNLAWIFATSPEAGFRNGKEAVLLAERACSLTGYEQPKLLGTLAAAQAEAGDYSHAVATAKKAAKQAEGSGQLDLRDRTLEMLSSFESGKSFHQR